MTRAKNQLWEPVITVSKVGKERKERERERGEERERENLSKKYRVNETRNAKLT